MLKDKFYNSPVLDFYLKNVSQEKYPAIRKHTHTVHVLHIWEYTRM
jgi:hypothetical protein